MLVSSSFAWSASQNGSGATMSSTVTDTRPILSLKPKYLETTPFSPMPRLPVVNPITDVPPRKRKRAQAPTSHCNVSDSRARTTEIRVKDDPESSTPPAKRVKRASKKGSTSPSPNAKRKQIGLAVPFHLISGTSSPNRVRSPSARSRSITEFGSLEGPIPRQCSTNYDGFFNEDIISACTVVKKLMRTYKSYFINPNDSIDKTFNPHPTDFPRVILEYPNTNSRETFPLLVPKDEDHYSPVKEVKKSLFTIIETYLTPSQAALFGTSPSQLCPLDFSPVGLDSQYPRSRTKSRSISRSTSPIPSSNDLLATLVYANNQRDGPLFVKTFQKITELLRSIKRGEYDDEGFPKTPGEMTSVVHESLPSPDPNPMRKVFKSWDGLGVPPKIWKTIIDETYQRAVGPSVPLLRKYPAWSSEAYGELETDFVSDIVHYTRLNPSSHFFDMGSGVGTVVLQVALQAGCSASGIEKMIHPATIAARHLEEFHKRCRLWGVEPGKAELLMGDFTDDDRVRERVVHADVVLCNNWAFSEKLNQQLLNHFLDMKEGAIVISLRSFVPPNWRLTEHTIGSPAAILRVEERPFNAGSVSWMGGGGVYFVNTIDRSMVADFHAHMLDNRPSRTRSSRVRKQS